MSPLAGQTAIESTGGTMAGKRFTPSLVADVQAVLERHGYRLPSGGGHTRDLVMDRVNFALKNLVEIFEGRTA